MSSLTELGRGKLLTEGAVRISHSQPLRDAPLLGPRRRGGAVGRRRRGRRRLLGGAPHRDAPRHEGHPARGRVLDALGLGPGRPVGERSHARVHEAAIRRALKEEGYFEAAADRVVEAGADGDGRRRPVRRRAGPRARPRPPQWNGSLAPLDGRRRSSRRRSRSRGSRTSGRVGRARTPSASRTSCTGVATRAPRCGSRTSATTRRRRPSRRVTPSSSALSSSCEVTGEKESVVREHADSPWKKGEPPDEDAVERLRVGAQAIVRGIGVREGVRERRVRHAARPRDRALHDRQGRPLEHPPRGRDRRREPAAARGAVGARDASARRPGGRAAT